MTAGGTDTQTDQCLALRADAITEWLETSQPGARIVYARGPQLIRTEGVQAITRAAKEGRVQLNQRRAAPGIMDYIATRRSDPAPVRREVRAEAPIAGDDAVLLRILERLAAGDRPCPTNRTLGTMMGGVRPDRVAYLLRSLRTRREIAIDRIGDGTRIVTITATGRRTRGGPNG